MNLTISKSFSFLFFMLFPLLGSAIELSQFKPYLGIEGQHRHMPYVHNFGDNIFKKNVSAGAIFGGIKFNDFLALEVGFGESKNKNSNSMINEGDYFLSSLQEPGDGTFNLANKTKIKTVHFTLLSFLPLDEAHQYKYFLGFGTARNTINHQTKQTAVDGIPLDGFTFNFNNKTNGLRLITGVEYLPFAHFGVRANVAFERTSRLYNLKPDGRPNSTLSLQAKNTTVFGLGVFATV